MRLTLSATVSAALGRVARKIIPRSFILERIRGAGERIVFRQSAGKVQSGPFKGMMWGTEPSSWGSQHLAPLLLGIYEEEVYPVIEEIIDSRPSVFVNIGCADGYFAVGLARRIPTARIIAVDIQEGALEATLANALKNDVKVEVSLSVPDDVPDEATYLIDVEGAERAILLEGNHSKFARAQVLVELHPWLAGSIDEDLVSRYSRTHRIRVIRSAGRNPNTFEMLAGMSDEMKWVLMSEGRPSAMEWLWMVPNS